MDVTVEYKLNGEQILELYNLTGANYISYFETAIFGAMQNAASQMEATYFSRNRSNAAEKMATKPLTILRILFTPRS